MSRAASGKVLFGEFLPDLPATDNPGLTEAVNVLPVDKFYRAYRPLQGTGDALTERPRGGIAAFDTAYNAFLYVGTATMLKERSGTTWTDRTPGTVYTTAADGYWRFAQFDDLVIGTNYADVPQAITAGANTDFANLALIGTAPRARQIGVVGRHVVLGDTIDGTNGSVPQRIQWCRIDDPTEWPTPNTTDALNKQAGEQFMPGGLGAVTGIVGNDQFGIVLQQRGVSRMTYVGGDLVFQFDTIDATRGATYPNATVQVGNVAYFISDDGFYATDGVSVRSIGAERFDRHFVESVDSSYRYRVYGALDKVRNLIYWSYPGPGHIDGRPNRLLIYNYREDRIARAEDVSECILSGVTVGTTLDSLDSLFGSIDDLTPSLDSPTWKGGNATIYGFTSDLLLATFSGAPGVAVIEAQEVELTPGGRSYISGVMPLVQSQEAVTVAIGTRNRLSDAVTYSAAQAPTSRTGFADFRADARFVRARVAITGEFPAAQGLQYQAQAAGYA